MKSFDLVIIGGGICGMTAAIYAARANIRACILEQQVCGRPGELDQRRGKRALLSEHSRH